MIKPDESRILKDKLNGNQFSKQPSSHIEFFQRIYGNLEKTNNSRKTQKHDEHEEFNRMKPAENIRTNYHNSPSSQVDSSSFLQYNSNSNMTKKWDTNSFSLPYYNLQLHSRNFQVSMKHLYSSVHVMPYAFGLSTFLPRKKRKEGKTIRRQRTTFTNLQTSHLENEFRINEYIPRYRRYKLAEYLQLSETQIKIWFQNRRAKDKRIEKAQLDQQYRFSILAQRWTSSALMRHNTKMRSWD